MWRSVGLDAGGERVKGGNDNLDDGQRNKVKVVWVSRNSGDAGDDVSEDDVGADEGGGGESEDGAGGGESRSGGANNGDGPTLGMRTLRDEAAHIDSLRSMLASVSGIVW
jgi:hypothetical protein